MPGALTLSSSGDRASIATSASISNLDPFTMLTFIQLSSFGGRALWCKNTTGANRKLLAESSSSATGNLNFLILRGTANTNVISSNAPMSTGKWIGVAVVFSSTSTAANDWAHIYTKSSSSTGVTEATYTTRSSGSGTVTSDSSGPMVWGNTAIGTNGMQGLLGHAGAVFAAKMGTSDINSWFACPRKTVGSNVARVFIRWGKSTGNQTDYSTNANDATLAGTAITTGNGPGVFIEEANPMLGAYALNAGLPNVAS